jgi:hypothetical protein
MTAYILVYILPTEGERSPTVEPFETRFEALSRLDELLREHEELSLVEIVHR